MARARPVVRDENARRAADRAKQWDDLAAAVREARVELDAAERAEKAAKDFREEAEACFRAAKGALIEFALGDAVTLKPQPKG